MKSAYSIGVSLNNAIRKAAAERAKDKSFSRKSSLTLATLIRLLIGAEGGSLDKISTSLNDDTKIAGANFYKVGTFLWNYPQKFR